MNDIAGIDNRAACAFFFGDLGYFQMLGLDRLWRYSIVLVVRKAVSLLHNDLPASVS